MVPLKSMVFQKDDGFYPADIARTVHQPPCGCQPVIGPEGALLLCLVGRQ